MRLLHRLSSIRIRLLLLVAIVTLPVLSLTIYSGVEQHDRAADQAHNEALGVARSIAAEQRRLVSGAQELLLALSLAPPLRGNDQPACNALLTDLLPSYPAYLNLGVASSSGGLRCSAVRSAPVNLSEQRWFLRAAQSRSFGTGDFQIDAITGKPALAVGYWIADSGAGETPVLFAALDMGWVSRMASQAGLPAGSTVTLLDSLGSVFASYPGPYPVQGESDGGSAGARAVLAQRREGRAQATDAQGQELLYSFTPVRASPQGASAFVSVGIPAAAVFAEVDRARSRNLIGVGVATAVALVLAWYFGLIAHKVDWLLEVTGRLTRGDLSARTGVRGRKSELDRLAAGLDEMAEALQRREAQAVEADRITKEIELAENFQQRMLPPAAIRVERMDVAAVYLTSNQIGGDYYDVFPRSRDLFTLVIADVSGHSLASGLMMTEARGIIRLLVRQGLPPGHILRQLNDTLYEDLDKTGLFVSVAVAEVDTVSAGLRYASAGHTPPVLYRGAGKDLVTLESTGPLIGITPSAEFGEVELPMDPGDSLVLYTDGVTEARDKEGGLFGEERLLQVVRANAHREARRTVEAIVADVLKHVRSRLVDDVTLLVLKRPAEARQEGRKAEKPLEYAAPAAPATP